MAIIFIISDIVLYQAFKGTLMITADNTLITAAEQAEIAISKVPIEKWREEIKRVERDFLVNRLFIQVLEIPRKKEDDFGLIAMSGVLAGYISHDRIRKQLANGIPENPIYMTVNESGSTGHPMRVILHPVKKGKPGKYLIEVGISLKKVKETLSDFLVILVISGPMMVLVSALVGFLILNKAIKPVRLVVQTARRITTEDLSYRIPSQDRKDEIGILITTLNEMIARLEHSVTQIKQFSIDASHDLKTPLTVIRGEIEITLRKERSSPEYRKTLASVHEEARKLETIVNNLLFLARIEGVDSHLTLQPVHIDEILLSVFEKTEQLAKNKHIAYSVKQVESVFIDGDEILLNRLLVNILDNAIKYTPEWGRIEIMLEKKQDGVKLEVMDTGIGIPPESLPFIFDRFYRADKARSQEISGSGLGLSIVKKIADIHRAKITVDSKLNQGTTVTLFFPFIVSRGIES